MKINRLILISTLALASFFTVVCSGSKGQPIPSEKDYVPYILKRNPALLKAWNWIIPKTYAQYKWMKLLTATSTPVDYILLSGKRFIIGQACWPHNCGGNHLIFLIAANSSEAYGLLSSITLKAPEVYFGAPPDEKVLVLRRAMRDNLHGYDEYYTRYRAEKDPG